VPDITRIVTASNRGVVGVNTVKCHYSLSPYTSQPGRRDECVSAFDQVVYCAETTRRRYVAPTGGRVWR